MHLLVAILTVVGFAVNGFFLIRAVVPARFLSVYQQGLKRIGVTDVNRSNTDKAGFIRKIYNGGALLLNLILGALFMKIVVGYGFNTSFADNSAPWWVYLVLCGVVFCLIVPLGLRKFFFFFNAWIIRGPDGFVVRQPLGKIYVLDKDKITTFSTETMSAFSSLGNPFGYCLFLNFIGDDGETKTCSLKRSDQNCKHVARFVARGLYAGTISPEGPQPRNVTSQDKYFSQLLDELEAATWTSFSDTEREQFKSLAAHPAD